MASAARDLVLEHGRHGRIHGLVAALLPKSIKHVKTRRSERATRASKPLKVIGSATPFDLDLLSEVPAQLGHIVQPERAAQFLAGGLLEERRCLEQMTRQQEPQLP